MRIAYLMQGTGVCGGTRVIWSHCVELAKRGHDVIYGITGGPEAMSWLPGDVPVRHVSRLQQEPWDVVVATGWTTWPVIHQGFPRARQKFGFVQMKESMFLGWPGARVADDAFSLKGFRVFTISKWLKKYLEEECGQEDVQIVPNGVDTEAFYPDPMPMEKKLPVALVVGHQLNEAKNISDAAKAIRMAGDFELWHVISHRPSPLEIIGADKIYISPLQDQLRRIYSTADVLVMSSRAEGRSCIPVEAMACKCPVVAMDHRGTEDLEKGRALIAERGDVEELAKWVRFTMESPEETAKRVDKAYRYVRRWLRWEKIGERLEELYGSQGG